jgi:capsular exopolysaccharide synthesis family protein
MSRNFELLQKIGQQQAFFDTQAAAETMLQEPAPAPVSSVPSLTMGDAEQEELTKLVQRAFLLPANEAPRAVVFTSTEAGNGCSWITARVGEVLASQVVASVCVVDANLRDPGLHQQFSVENHHGLADALRQGEPIRAFARPLSRSNLYLLSCGSSPEEAQGLLASDRMRLRLSELRSEFDYVLIDTPAINVANDGVVLGAASDGMVLVLKANSSRRETARQAIHDLQAAKAKVLGAVLNQRTFPIPESLYHKL